MGAGSARDDPSPVLDAVLDTVLDAGIRIQRCLQPQRTAASFPAIPSASLLPGRNRMRFFFSKKVERISFISCQASIEISGDMLLGDQTPLKSVIAW